MLILIQSNDWFESHTKILQIKDCYRWKYKQIYLMDIDSHWLKEQIKLSLKTKLLICFQINYGLKYSNFYN